MKIITDMRELVVGEFYFVRIQAKENSVSGPIMVCQCHIHESGHGNYKYLDYARSKLWVHDESDAIRFAFYDVVGPITKPEGW